MALALGSAVLHALFGALQKGRHDPWLSRGAIDAWWLLLGLPAAVLLLPRPDGRMLATLAGAAGLHFVYKLTVAFAYDRGRFTVVYPVARGTGPLATVAIAAVVFGEVYGPAKWSGVVLLSGAIMALAAVSLRQLPVGGAGLRAGLGWAAASGLMIAVFTVYDAWAIRMAADPFVFLGWFFVATSLDFPLIAIFRWRRLPAPPAPWPLALRGLAGAVVGVASFSAIMLATRIGPVGEAAALRETSVLFAALIGRVFLGEPIGAARAGLMGLIAAGAVLTQAG